MFELVHVPREQNARADLLAKLASSGKGGRQRIVIQETLKTPRKFVADNSKRKAKEPPLFESRYDEGTLHQHLRDLARGREGRTGIRLGGRRHMDDPL